MYVLVLFVRWVCFLVLRPVGGHHRCRNPTIIRTSNSETDQNTALHTSPTARSYSFQLMPSRVIQIHTFSLSLFDINPRSGVLRTQKLKTHLSRTQSSQILPFEPGVGPYVVMLLLLPGISSLLIPTFPVHSPAFFPNPPPSVSCVGCG